ncbi:LysR substrate-binding domain-containing protein [Ensifer sp. LC499]|uniref:LysR family transcriptional regulator n=1 Tax=unclassified Ensifer TaxID=2633371 RepID=UPI00081321AC|nr:LysR substrate-binding domain-containing protein [Ensifer sp. LC499]OCP00441.1 LysR family transcriptional regulator [Ensifer sp. LC13]OCP00447.1 LysR family transcriptional regulator [Ensifer sp. LC11]OCP10317.1 LysR family transcriptional regulator [Ensifer sp. LC14]OCP29476.1 LysR family transcriptional regulator [Ensifer sp. LC499]
MEIKWLEDFLALASTLNFSKAADERHVTQSAFSRRIRQLEAWLGATLVDRATYPSRLTEAGAIFVPVAQATLKQLHQSRRDLQEEEGSDARTIRLTALHTLSFTFFPGWMTRINAKVGPLFSRLRPDSGSMEENLNSLVDGECDFLLTYAHTQVPHLLDPQAFEHRVLGQERILAVSAADETGAPLHPLEDGAKPFPHLSYEKSSFFGQLLGDLIDPELPPGRKVHEGSMSVGLKAMAEAGWGVAWVPESLMTAELAKGSLVRAAAPLWDISVEIRLYRARDNRRPIVGRVWQSLETAAT